MDIRLVYSDVYVHDLETPSRNWTLKRYWGLDRQDPVRPILTATMQIPARCISAE
jgi:hypothetical protein